MVPNKRDSFVYRLAWMKASLLSEILVSSVNLPSNFEALTGKQ